MSDLFNDASILVHIAALFYVAGFLVRDQLILRLLVLIGTLLYLSGLTLEAGYGGFGVRTILNTIGMTIR